MPKGKINLMEQLCVFINSSPKVGHVHTGNEDRLGERCALDPYALVAVAPVVVDLTAGVTSVNHHRGAAVSDVAVVSI